MNLINGFSDGLIDGQVSSWLYFIRDRRWSRRQKHELLSKYGNPMSLYELPNQKLQALIVKPKKRKQYKVNAIDVERDQHWLASAGNRSLVTIDSDLFPSRLKCIADPPLALFVEGDVALLSEPQVAIVGSRRPTPVGAKMAQSLAAQLSSLGVIVTSGMALGVDGVSHVGALNQGNPTVAVMGCGLDVIYPARHRGLFDRIRDCGVCVSEYPTQMRPTKYTFPERNRIVSGMSLGVIIVEAAAKSGTLITARFAAEQNREVMVLPGSAVSSQYVGSHLLIRDGAVLVTCVEDVLNALRLELSSAARHERLEDFKGEEKDLVSSDEASLLALIGADSVSADELISSCRLTPAQVSSMLLILELDGRIALSDDGGYINLT